MEQPDILLRNVTAVTVDEDRRVIDRAWIAVKGDRISGLGSEASEAPPEGARQVIDGSGMIAMPGLIDSHSHAGHGLVRSAGSGDVDRWFEVCEEIYARGSTTAFWRAEARLTLLERLQGGVTTAMTLLGGGADIMRTDDPAFGDAHCNATVESGLRTILAVGPGRPPYPRTYRRFGDDGQSHDAPVSFERQLEVCETLIDRWDDVLERRTGVSLTMPVYYAKDVGDVESLRHVREMGDAVMALRQRKNVLFTQDGHRDGSIALARDLGVLSRFALLGHSVDLTPEDFEALKETGASIIHNPSAIMSIYGRCPVPELIDAGITVCLGSDAAAPDRGYDMFRHMAQCMHYHRRHFRDPDYMPPGKTLEMATIDAARALGLDKDLGSLETGKKADIVLVDARKAHMYPPGMPVTRLAHFANAADVDTVIVNGKVLMRGRQIPHLDIPQILDEAAHEQALAFERVGMTQLWSEPASYWRTSRRVVDTP
ncbi:amidohydrolase [Rhizobium sp. Root73]|uniref:amidohydrolase family protein n=1 Tax=unclassified Rhizobium TaxID=2613769 RepID=UPI00072727F4|nr:MULTISPECIES: amidohydrolase family protein [unclassified Rhizobium]KQY10454.1 amidohydrolase [Rhizobium sp. Root1334]KRC03920.1 amidohydrolase [Rhizobium sp. Root73]